MRVERVDPFGFKISGSRVAVGVVRGCGPGGSRWRHEGRFAFGSSDEPGDLGGFVGALGVRRPLRFLAYKLQLDEDQIKQLAQILDELKTERAQAAVDHRRTLAAFADAVVGGTFDEGRASAGASLRTSSAEHLKDSVMSALRRIHALLRPEQRAQFAYLIRTGRLMI